MSPVIALDKAVVAQKVKVCYIMADMLNLKKWVASPKIGAYPKSALTDAVWQKIRLLA